MTISTISALIDTFDALPKKVKQITYLGLCKYPRHRFEEICSRLLSFYLAPKEDHGFEELFLSSLLELISGHPVPIHKERVIVKNEENAEGKRLDILVHSDTFVVGIENKITANIYNPLEIYKNRIELFGRETDMKFKVVLSLNRIQDKNELRLMAINGFVNITFAEYFQVIKNKMGYYLNNRNSQHLIFINDFIQTIMDMDDSTMLNDQLSNYFYEHSNQIDSLISLYNRYNTEVLSRQIERISELKNKISELTKKDWWAHEGWDLGFNTFDVTKPKIGIESSFECTKGDPLGKFKISITTWSLEDWSKYERKILSDFPNFEINKIDNRVIIVVEPGLDNNEGQILRALSTWFDYLANVVEFVGAP